VTNEPMGTTPPPAAGSYPPATFTFDPPEKIARWRVIGNIILAIPHFIVIYALNIVAELLALVAWILGVFTGKVPEGILGIIAMYIRYSTRVGVFAGFLTEEYPPFTLPQRPPTRVTTLASRLTSSQRPKGAIA
jgi:hypothetical protein